MHGTDAYVEAIESTLEVTRFAADEIGRRDYLEAVREPDLSVVVFRRLGWGPEDYQAWTDRLLGEEFAFVVPTTFRGETLTRFAIVNPHTTKEDVNAIHRHDVVSRRWCRSGRCDGCSEGVEAADDAPARAAAGGE